MDSTIIISDLHLGSEVCQAKSIHYFLKDIHKKSNRLILNGDVFDSIDFRRLKKQHWKILSDLRKISDKMEVVWICGNHDGDAETISHILGLRAVEQYEFTSGGKRVLALHGHVFDEFISKYPKITMICDWAYAILQWIDGKLNKTHYLSRSAKHSSKQYLHCVGVIKDKSIKLARQKDCQIVVTGHTHHEMDVTESGVQFLNSGCWTEVPCHYIEIIDGEAKVKKYETID